MRLLCQAAVAVLVLLTGAAAAETYPDRPVRIVVPWPAGGIVDALARIVGQQLGDQMGQRVLVENRVGAASVIGADNVAKSAPDGYTLLLTSSGHTINAALAKSLPYDTLADFTPIALLATAPSVLVVHPGVPAKTVGEFVALAKASPGKLSYGSAGIGSFAQILAELFKSAAKVDLLHVPYRGQPQVVTDLVAGRIDAAFVPLTVAQPQVAAGHLRALAVTSSGSIAAMPGVPGFPESGVPDLADGQWMGLLGPKGLPTEVVVRLRREIGRALGEPAVRGPVEQQGMVVVGDTTDRYATILRDDVARWTDLAAKAGLQAN